MPGSPRVSVLVQIPATTEEIEALVTMLAGQTLQEWELVAISAEKPKTTDTRVRVLGIEPPHSPKEVRQVLLENASGNYVLFLCPGDTIATPRQLELHVLWAEAEQAKICVGRVRNETWTMWPKTPQEGWCAAEVCPEALPLCGVLFQRTWVRACGLRFHSVCTRSDMAFWCEALALAGRCFMRRDVFIAMPTKGDYVDLPRHTQTVDCLIGMAELARFSKAHAVAWLHARQYEAMFGERFRAIVDCLSAVFPEQRQTADDAIAALEAAFDPALAPAFVGRSPMATFLEPLVSVIVPVYNTAPYLRRCLLSLKAQTLPNIEIICVNDGSTDDSLSILETMKAEMPNLVVLSQENAGQGAARNAAMRIAKGRYIGFVDSDDWVEPEMFERMAEGLEAHLEADIAECGTACEWAYEIDEQEKTGLRDYYRKTLPPGLQPISPQALMTGGPCDKLFRAGFLSKNGIHFPEGVKNEDEAFCFFALCRASWFVLFHDQWYHYIRNASGTMAQQVIDAGDGCLPDVFSVLNVLIEFAEEEDKIPFIGRLLKGIIGAVRRFEDTPLRDRVYDVGAYLLRKAKFDWRADFIAPVVKPWCLTYAQTFINRCSDQPPMLAPLHQWLPKPRVSVATVASDSPIVTFIVPVYNVAAYLSRCLESLRAQTLTEIEILCIDDGSTDESLLVLVEYLFRDPRVRVFCKPNSGVSGSRNLGIRKARGKYIAFVDSDDWIVSNMAKETVMLAEAEDLEMIHFDFQCVDYKTERFLDHYWMVRNHLDAFPKTIFSGREFSNLMCYSGSCGWLYQRVFLLRNHLSFPSIKLGEDFYFVLRALAYLRRGRLLPKTFYYYRKGAPSSAVSRLSRGESSAADIAKLAFVKGLIAYFQEMRSLHLSDACQSVFVKRVALDLFYYAEASQTVRDWLNSEGWRIFHELGVDFERFTGSLLERYHKLRSYKQEGRHYSVDGNNATMSFALRLLTSLRRHWRKDLYIVTGQLNSTTNEPIDSWTFFQWLQAHKVPSRYVMWKRHSLYAKLKQSGQLKDVIALSSDGVGTLEFLRRCFWALVRAKAVVQENGALNPLLRAWLYRQLDCEYVFLQHGVFFWKMAHNLAAFLSTFNSINVSGDRERAFLQSVVPANARMGGRPDYVIGGLPRWDLLKDESATSGERVVFVMFTWRETFNAGAQRFEESQYYWNIRAFLNPKNLEKLQTKHVRVVIAPHHHLAEKIKGLDFGVPVEVAETEHISWWIRHASLCVTDYSSVSFDFLFLNKPVVYWLLDRNDRALMARDREELAFAESQASQMFNIARTSEDVVQMIERYAENNFVLEPEKRAIAESFFTYKKDICRHLYENLEAALQSQKVQLPMGATQEGGEA